MQTQRLDFQPTPAKHPVAAAAPGELQVRLVSAMEPLEADWRRLEQDDRASLHQGYDWCAAWAGIQANPLAIIQGICNERTVFILPLEILRMNGVRTAQFIAAEHSNINTGLFDHAFLASADDAALAGLRRKIGAALKGAADILLLQRVPLEWRQRQSPLSALPHIRNQNRAYQLPLLDTFEETLKQINAKSRRKKFRVQSRRLEASGGYEHVIAATQEEQHALLDVLFRQKAARFRSLGLPDVFDEATVRAFFHRLIDVPIADASDYPLRLHGLRLGGEHGGRFASVSAVSRKGDHVICQFSAIDETAVPDASPGEMLFHLVISHLHGKGVALFDFGVGYQVYKRSWCPVETAHHDVILPLTARGQVAALVQRVGTRAKIFVKAHPGLYALLQRIRARSGKSEDAASENPLG